MAAVMMPRKPPIAPCANGSQLSVSYYLVVIKPSEQPKKTGMRREGSRQQAGVARGARVYHQHRNAHSVHYTKVGGNAMDLQAQHHSCWLALLGMITCRVTAYVGIAQRMTYIRVWRVWRLYAVPYVLT